MEWNVVDLVQRTMADFSVYDSGSMTQVLDSLVYNNPPVFNFEFTAVPEPTSALTAVSLGCLGAMYRRRRRRTSQQESRFQRWRKWMRSRKAYRAPFVGTKNWL